MSGGDSFCYLGISINPKTNTGWFYVIHQGEYNLYDVHIVRGPQSLDSFSCEFAGYGRVGNLGLGRIHRGFYILGYYGVVAGCTHADSPR